MIHDLIIIAAAICVGLISVGSAMMLEDTKKNGWAFCALAFMLLDIIVARFG
jgi:hypothetical protein